MPEEWVQGLGPRRQQSGTWGGGGALRCRAKGCRGVQQGLEIGYTYTGRLPMHCREEISTNRRREGKKEPWGGRLEPAVYILSSRSRLARACSHDSWKEAREEMERQNAFSSLCLHWFCWKTSDPKQVTCLSPESEFERTTHLQA